MIRRWLKSRQDLPFLAILVGLWALFFWRYIAPQAHRVVFPDGDFTQQFFIFRDIAFRQLAAGHLPLWTDCFFGGYPFHADPQSQLFYPPVWMSFGLLRLLGYGHFPLMALTLEAISHYLASSIFAFWFLKEETGSRKGALLGSIVLAYGGYLTGYPPLQTGILETVTWLPLALLALQRLAAGRSLRAGAAAVGALSIAFLAGHPQTFLFSAYLSLAYFVFRARETGWRWQRIIATAATIFVLAGSVSAVQLLPQAQFLALSTRAGLPFDQLSAGLPVGDIAQLFVTQLVSRWQPLYIGIAGLVLAVLALALYANAKVIFWLGAALVGLLLSFGGNAAGYPLAYWLIPGYRLFRGQERAAVIFAMAAATLVGLGAAAVWSSANPRKQEIVTTTLRWLRNLTPFAIVLLIASIFLAQSGLGDWGHLPPRFGLLLLGLVLTILALAAQRAQLQWHAALLIGVVTLELFSANARTNATSPFETYGHLPLLDPIQVDAATGRWFRVQDDARMQGHWACGYGLREWGGISPIRLQSWANFEEQAPELVRWSLLGIDYLITWKEDLNTREGAHVPAEVVFAGAAPLGEAQVFRLDSNPKRAWLVSDISVVDSQAALWEAVREPGFDARRQSVLLDPLAGELNQASGTVEVVTDRPGYLELRGELDTPVLLVVSEAWYPGWYVVDDAGRKPTVMINGFAQGARVDDLQQVQVVYQPPLLQWGAIISMIGLIVVVGLAFSRRQLPE